MAKRLHKEDSYFQHNKVQFIPNGPAYFKAVYQLLDETKEEIHFQTYIFQEDETGHQMADALIRTAHRGVQINLLVDAYGSKALSEATISRMKAAGIKVRKFGPLLSKGKIHFGRRLHQKILVSDRKKAIVAGINVSNNYSGIHEKTPWLDFGVLVEGEIIPSLLTICLKIWLGFGMKRLRHRMEKNRMARKDADTTFHVRVRPLENDGLRGKY